MKRRQNFSEAIAHTRAPNAPLLNSMEVAQQYITADVIRERCCGSGVGYGKRVNVIGRNINLKTSYIILLSTPYF